MGAVIGEDRGAMCDCHSRPEALRAAADNPVIASGLNICRKQITNRAVARTFGLALSDPAAMLA